MRYRLSGYSAKMNDSKTGMNDSKSGDYLFFSPVLLLPSLYAPCLISPLFSTESLSILAQEVEQAVEAEWESEAETKVLLLAASAAD